MQFKRGEDEWSINGIPNIKNLVHKAEKHQISKKHLTNKESFHMLGKNRIEHSISESLDINRKILARLIDVVCFLEKQELAFRGHRENEGSLNKGNYCEILDLLAKEEQFIREHFLTNSVFKGTSHDIRNDLIHCVTTIEERFIGFFDVSKNKTAAGLSEVILNELSKWDIGQKVVCQTYDAASVMAGEKNGVQSIIQNIYPMAIFIHCYAHQLNLVLFHGAKTIKYVKLYRSSKRSVLLREQGFKLPNQCNTRWNYHSRAALTIKTHFNELKNAVSHVVDDPGWDSTSVCTTSDLKYTNEEQATLRRLTFEIIDSLIVQINIRFKDFEKLEFVEIINEKMFASYKVHFPEEKLRQLFKYYPDIFDKDRLKNELYIIYADPLKYFAPLEFIDYIFKNELQEVYQEVTKLIQLVLTIPATTASSKRSMSTLKRIKSFLRNSMTNDRLSSLSSLAIEKKIFKKGLQECKRPGDWALSKSTPVHIEKLKEERVEREKYILNKKVGVKPSSNTGTPVRFGKDDVVYYKAHHLSKAHKDFHAGFAPKWWGPVTLAKQFGKGVFLTDQQPPRKIHVSCLKHAPTAQK
ncbi:hypothetical protein QTP88_004017 [Uroleucon formosanum]